jgi:hypothetical protein
MAKHSGLHLSEPFMRKRHATDKKYLENIGIWGRVGLWLIYP